MMPLDVLFVFCLSAGIVGFAIWRGGPPERIGAAIIALDLCIDLAVRQWVGQWDFSAFSTRRLLVDVVEFGLLLWLALRANRVWPVLSAASQLVAVAGNLAVLGTGGGMSAAYWAVTQTPLFGQLMALAIGTYLHRRRLALLGPYRDWRNTAGQHQQARTE